MTYNVHGGVGGDGKLDLGRIAAVIAQARPDIVALQELDVGRARSGGVDQAHTLAARLGMSCHFNAAFSVAEERYGDAILTALPQALIKAGPLPTPKLLRRLEPRGAVWTSVTTSDGPLQVINTHLGLTPQEQKVQVHALLGPDWLGHMACRGPVILLGDMNATRRYAAYRMMAARLRDVEDMVDGSSLSRPALRTFPARLPLLRLDHMFIGGGGKVARVECPNFTLAKVASDHRPLVVDLEF